MRTAIGAAPRHIVVQLLAESADPLGGGRRRRDCSSPWSRCPSSSRVTPVAIPRLDEAAVSLRVLGLAVALVAGMTMTFGLVPSLVLVRRHTASDLKAGGRGSSRDTRALHQGLVIAEVALACALLVASALLVRTVGAMTRVPLGVAPKDVVARRASSCRPDSRAARGRQSPSSTRPSSSASASSRASSRPAAPTILPWSTAGATRSSPPIRRSPAPKIVRRCSTTRSATATSRRCGATHDRRARVHRARHARTARRSSSSTRRWPGGSMPGARPSAARSCRRRRRSARSPAT